MFKPNELPKVFAQSLYDPVSSTAVLYSLYVFSRQIKYQNYAIENLKLCFQLYHSTR